MIEKREAYKCDKCGNLVLSLLDGEVDVNCCGEVMKKLTLNTVDAAVEKHVPVMERSGNIVKVKVGDVPHPMTKEHHIVFVEVHAGSKVYRHEFEKGDEIAGVAEATFLIEEEVDEVRSYCNLHGYWKSV